MESRRVITAELIWKPAIETQIEQTCGHSGGRESSIENIH